MNLLPFDYCVRNLGRSPARLAMTISAGALVVILIMSAAAFVGGMSKSLSLSADKANVILLGSGSEESLERSQIAGNTAGVISADLGGVKNRFGVQYVSPEVHVAMMVRRQKDGKELRALMRGFTPEAFLVHSRVQVTEGRVPLAGRNEVMVGGLAPDMMGVPDAELKPGSTLWFDNKTWTIVGRFSATGTVMDAEVWAPLTDLQLAVKRNTVSCVVVTMAGGDFDDVDAFTKQRLDLELTAIREDDYFGSIMKFYAPVRAMIWSTAIIVALAGVLGGLNTMYSAFAGRVREIGTLQALGYSRTAITVNLVEESILMSLAGTLLGAVFTLVFVNSRSLNFSMGVFQLIVDEHVLFIGLTTGLILGLIGAIPPVWRCLRLPITEALKTA
jgi:putative ABC transport system permease protein